MRFVLASASPRRRELLAAAGFAFDVDAADVDERSAPDESPAAYVVRVATAKAKAVAARHAGRVVLAADTTVVVGDQMLGKPGDAAEATRMLQRLAGRAHDVLSAVVVIADGRLQSAVERTAVWMAPMTADEIDWYVRSGEPMDKAGAYAIQGLASRFVTRIDGSYSNVVGLPVATVAGLLKGLEGLPYSDG